MADHDLLIEQLSQNARPIRRTWASNRRVAAWLLMALPCGWLSSLVFQRVATDWTQSGALLAALQLIVAFVTGTLAIRNAFLLSIAGRKPLGWRGFIPLIAIWLGSVMLSLGQTHVQDHHPDEVNCYVFMMAVSAPMVAIVIGYLRRTRALYPLRTLATAGAGVACMALTLLSFCHPVEVHPVDFLLHVAAGVTIVIGTMVAGWWWVTIR
ncbi:DUF1109 family protein [Enterobacter oligotrophicus]|uniref:DUF1109 family protein n=1 Tax=Enterobacter oligotrophicus TaxID=2478464 RepID=UPI00126050BF|nr:DUF1109 family protein [Enterobacter oligotrophicus]